MITELVARIRHTPGFSRWTDRTRLIALSLGACLAIGLFAAAGVAYFTVRDAEQTQRASTEAIEAAKTAVPKVLTYQPDSVQSDLAAAADFLTGEFRDKFTSMARQVIAPAAQSQGIRTSATVAATSVVSADADRVALLMFVNQTTTTSTDPAPRVAGSRVTVVLERSGQSWKISELTPM